MKIKTVLLVLFLTFTMSACGVALRRPDGAMIDISLGTGMGMGMMGQGYYGRGGYGGYGNYGGYRGHGGPGWGNPIVCGAPNKACHHVHPRSGSPAPKYRGW